MAVLNKRAIVTAIEMYGVTAIRLGSAPNPSLDALIKALFTSGEQGFAYDPNDLTTLYQDAAGTIPVTAAGQPVGLMLDKSKGLVLGGELVTNGGFNNGLVGWSGSNSVTLNRDTTIFSNGGAKITVNASVSTYFSTNLGSNFVVGKRYIASADVYTPGTNTVDNVAAIGFVSSGLMNNTVMQKNTNVVERISMVFVATSTTHALYCSVVKNNGAAWGAIGDIAHFDNISVRELAGNHAYQSVPASRPLLQYEPILGSNLVTNGDFSNGGTGWGTTGTPTFTFNTGRAYYNGTGVSGSGALFNDAGMTVGKTYEISYDYEVIQGSFMAGGTLSGTIGGRNITGKGRRYFNLTVTDARDKGVNFRPENRTDICEFYIDNVSVKEVTGYRTGQNYLAFDGVDDFLQTSSINFTATDTISLYYGLDRNIESPSCIIAELSTSVESNIGTFSLTCASASGLNYFGGNSRGVTTSTVTDSTSNPLAVISNKFKISTDTATMKLNGVATSNSVDQGTGNYGTYPMYIGRRGGTTLPFKGKIYSLIGIGRLTTDSETIALEKSIAKNVGVVI